MASLLEIRKKIKSVKQTRKITKAMQLVSASKMKVFQKKAVSCRSYAWDLLSVLKRHIPNQKRSLFLEQRESGKTLFVQYSSDKGLCGALNTKLSKALFTSRKWTETPADQRLLITIGKKAMDFARYNEIPLKHHFNGLNEQMTTLDALDFIKPIVDLWISGDVKEILMIAPHYQSTLVFYPLVKTFLPFSDEMISRHLNIEEESTHENIYSPTNTHMYYEPSEERIIEVLFTQVIQLLFIQSFFELKAAEYSSRMIAMQNATDNADDIIRKLTLTYNKARQARITQELSEISGAMAAM
ncbi:MAG: ATP synthase F1 subunit gamma [bacterium]|nr:ATP synthase F1 subunit gamma [bacterium]